MGIAKKYSMAFMSPDEWVEEMLNQLSVDIGDILQFVEEEDFRGKMREFKNQCDQDGAMDWIARTLGHDSAAAMRDAHSDYDAYENSGVYDDD